MCMQMLIKRKIAWSHADIPPSCLLHDAVYQDGNENKVRTGAIFERLLSKLGDSAGRIREQHRLPTDSPLIIIMDWVTSRGQEALTPIKGHPQQCKNHPSQYILFARKRRSNILNLQDQLINATMRRFVRFSLRDRIVMHGMRIHDKEIPISTPLHMSERTMKSLLVQWVSAWCKETIIAQEIVRPAK